MSIFPLTPVVDICEIKPQKKEAKEKLVVTDEVSFVPMNDLGICQKEIHTTETRLLSSVYSGYTYFADNDVLLAKITPCFENGKLGIARNLKNGIGFGSSEYIVFRPKKQLYSEYLFYYLAQDSFRQAGAKVMTGAVGHKRVPKEFVNSLTIPLPPLPEQKRIVAILDEAFAGIDQAIANTERNLANARELFDSYLNEVLHQSASKKPTQTLTELTELIVDCEHKTAPTQESGYPSIRTPNIGKGELLLDGVYRVSEETYKIWTRRAIPQADDLILAREAPAGNVGVVPQGENVCLGQRTVLIRPKLDILNSEYLAFLMLHPIMQKRLLAGSTGATVQHVNVRDIRSLGFGPLPSKTLQNKVVCEIKEMKSYSQSLQKLYQQKSAALAQLKQSLLQKAFTGELTADWRNQQEAAA